MDAFDAIIDASYTPEEITRVEIREVRRNEVLFVRYVEGYVSAMGDQK